MFKENFNQLNKPESKNEADPNSLVNNFKEAIEEKSLIGYYLSDDKEDYLKNHNLSDFEKSLISKDKIPSISLMIDIDGVLIDTEEELKKIYNILTSNGQIAKNTKTALDSIKNSKISFSILKTLLRARDEASEIYLITDRLGQGPCYFPCFGKDKKQTLEEHNINLKTNAFKMFLSGDNFLPMIKRSDIVYYIGSSKSDRIYTNRLRDSMKNYQEKNISSPIPDEKLKYLEVSPTNRKRNIL